MCSHCVILVCVLGNKKINTEMFKIFLILIFSFKFNPRRNVLLCSIQCILQSISPYLLYKVHVSVCILYTHMNFIQQVWRILYRIYSRHFIVYIIGNHMSNVYMYNLTAKYRILMLRGCEMKISLPSLMFI